MLYHMVPLSFCHNIVWFVNSIEWHSSWRLAIFSIIQFSFLFSLLSLHRMFFSLLANILTAQNSQS